MLVLFDICWILVNLDFEFRLSPFKISFSKRTGRYITNQIEKYHTSP